MAVKTFSKKDVDETLKERDKVLFDYDEEEEKLLELFKKYPTNTDIKSVFIKVKFLNTFYSTGLYGIEDMIEHILNLKNVDSRLKTGDPTLVDEIARITKAGKCYFSFASKYCSFHNPEKYPIWDTFVKEALQHYLNENKSWLPNIKRGKHSLDKLPASGYKDFLTLYDSFRENFFDDKTISYKDMDKYLWGARKICSLSKTNLRLTHKGAMAAYTTICANTLNTEMK